MGGREGGRKGGAVSADVTSVHHCFSRRYPRGYLRYTI